MKLTITLSPTEEANLRAWAQWLRTHPEYIGVTSGDWNGGQATYQSRIVLEEQTAERFDEIAAQVLEPAPSCPAGTTYLAHLWGDSRRVELPAFGETPVVVTLAVPADAPASTILGRVSVYEFRGEPHMRQLSISTRGCDFRDAPDPTGESGPLVITGGVVASASFGVGGAGDARLVAGMTYCINMRNAGDPGVYPAAYEIMWPR